jgi:5,5'-dehydrodivanillate O-demethylase oxygenase subunit
MLSVEHNERLTQVSKGTPMGELMRRYWHPVAATAELDDRPTKSVRILGEDLVLYKDRSGTMGLIDALCPHRRVDMSYGIPEEQGLRCMYHGWMFNETGQCIEQPFEETVHPDGRFKEKVKINSYPVESMGGMIFTYMGPQPAPLLPRWEPFTWEDAWCEVGIVELPCNWLQCMENSMDPVHLEWLHGYWGVHQEKIKAERTGKAMEIFPTDPKSHKKIGFDQFDYGIIKRRVVEGTTEDDTDWKTGHPVVFPQILFVGSIVTGSLQYRVPVDDTHTMHYTWFFYRPGPGADKSLLPQQDSTPYWYVPLYDESGVLIPDLVNHQDFVAWITQGAVADRSHEILGESDRGVIMYRKMLDQQMAIVEDGGDPLGTVRDAKVNQCIDLPLERWQALSHPARLASYAPTQAAEPLENISNIEKILKTWANETPWVAV